MIAFLAKKATVQVLPTTFLQNKNLTGFLETLQVFLDNVSSFIAS